tara:strand:+ start:1659 stop:2603 length:945 start_codon:yes stop_codon:yes gene_type:complete
MKYTVDGKEVGATTAATIVEEVNQFSGQTIEELRQQTVRLQNGIVPEKQEPTKAMKRGTWIEPYIKQEAFRQIREALYDGTKLEDIEVKDADRIPEERLGCSCDAKLRVNKDLIIPNPAGNDFPMNGLIILEMKSDAYSKSIVPPIFRYEVQLHVQMACTGSKFGIIAKMGSDLNVKLYPFKRSEKLVALIMSKVREFWYKVDHDIPYEINDDKPPVINLDDHAIAKQLEVMLDSRMTAKAECDKWKESLETIDAQIQGVMQKLNSERATFKNYLIDFKTVNVAAKPEQVTPAKPARSHKRFSIKEIAHEPANT